MTLQEHDRIALELRQITKVYPGVVALDSVSLSIKGGEVVGLIGENGAGKSTLMKVLGGVIAPNGGEIVIDGETLEGLSSQQALDKGIAFVHQELNPFTNLDVAANVLLGRELRRGPFKFIDQSAMNAVVAPILERLGAHFGPRDSVADLSLAEQQLLEIARALSMNARLVIFDEPTSSLTLSETHRLLDVIKDLRAEGVAVLFISHRLSEIEEIADRVVVLRDGKNAGELGVSDINKDVMIRMMVGRNVEQFFAKIDHSEGDCVLEVRDLATQTFPDARANLQLKAGEILGLAGLVGAGRSEMAHAIFGIEPVKHGEVFLHGEKLSELTVSTAIANGLCLVPENRKEHGLFLDFAIYENISLPNLGTLSKRGVVYRKAEQELASKSRSELAIKTATLANPVAELSGGNQQKVVLAKWLAMNPRVVILDEPTRGIDVGAKSEVYHLMQALAAKGVGILMISSDMEEIIGVSDRVAVMHKGNVTGTVSGDEITEENILRLAVG